MKNPTTLVVLALLGFAPAAAASSSPPGAAARATAYLDSLTQRGAFSGVVLVARDGKPSFRLARGEADVSWHVANRLDSRFEIASLTKQFTGCAILQLAEAGRLDVHDPVSKYYATAPAAWKDITIEQLVTHRSGLPGNAIKDFPKGITVPYTPEELIATFRDRPLVAPPGTKWAYTNTEYYLLAYIIEKVSGESYAEYLRRHIFEPADMHESGFASTLAIVPNEAEGYAREGTGLRHRDYFDRSLELGAGGIHSTIADLLAWNVALDHDTLLHPASRVRMFTPDSLGSYGYGWFIARKPRLREFHEGSDPGFAAFEARYPDDHLLIVVLANLEDAPVREIEARLAVEFLKPVQ